MSCVNLYVNHTLSLIRESGYLDNSYVPGRLLVHRQRTFRLSLKIPPSVEFEEARLLIGAALHQLRDRIRTIIDCRVQSTCLQMEYTAETCRM